MMRWIMSGLAALGFAMVFVAKTPLVLGLGLMLGMAGLIGAVLALAADRIAANSRPESVMLSGEDLVAMRRVGNRPPDAASAPAAESAGSSDKHVK
ncbi:MAG: hypothetical protein WB784_05870 [Rhodanobacteraceae bacterium]